MESIEKVRHILQSHFRVSDWLITRPQNGQQAACFIAQSDDQKLFIKRDVPIGALQQLGEIRVAPRVIASGVDDGHPYIIQQYIAGTYPDWRWLTNNLAFLADFMKHYHDDRQLTSLLSLNNPTNFIEHITLDIAILEKRLRSLDMPVFHSSEIISAFEILKSQARRLQTVELVPIHPDPNTKNMLLTMDTMVLVDWDDIALSDPMRDIGLVLWWYVPRQRWDEFFEAYGLHIDDLLIERIFWWAARTSFAVALWHVEHRRDYIPFLTDCIAALHSESNPRAVFS